MRRVKVSFVLGRSNAPRRRFESHLGSSSPLLIERLDLVPLSLAGADHPCHPLLVSKDAAANAGRAFSPTGADGPTGTQALTELMLARRSEPQLWP